MAEYFVSNQGQNYNPGTIAEPFKTISKAAKVAQAGDICYIREGTYREWIQPRNSGEPGRPIVFKAYENEKVVLSGAKPIQGEWQLHEKGIYKITLDPKKHPDLGIGNNQVFIDGEMAIEARWPKIDNPVQLTRDNHEISSDGGIVETTPPSPMNQRLSYYESPGLKQFPDGFWNQAYISMIPGWEWWGNVGKVTSFTSGRVNFEFDASLYWEFANTPQADDPFYLWGIYEALEAEKEWYFDVEGTQGEPHTLYLMPPGGSLEGKVVQMKASDEIFCLNNRSHIHIENIHLFAGRINLNPKSSDNVIDGIVSEYGTYGQTFSKFPSPPIRIQGDRNQLINSVISKTASAAIVVRGNHHIIQNNVIHDAGYVAAASDGIQMSDAKNLQVSNNTIFNTSSVAMSAKAKNSEITYNHVWNIGLQKTDTAAINAFDLGDAEGMEVAYNLVHDILSYRNVENKSQKHYGGKGIRFDSGKTQLGNSNYIIHDNIVYNTNSHSIVIWGLQDSHLNYKNANINVYNNTVESKIFVVNRDDFDHKETLIEKNLAHQYSYGSKELVPDGLTLVNNLLYNGEVPENLNRQAILDQPFPSPVSEASLPNYYLPSQEAGVVQSPYKDSQIQLGDLDIGAKSFTAGAIILEKDIPNLSASINDEKSQQVKISGLPIGRKVPESFQVKVGDSPAFSNCYNLTDTANGKTTVICEINLEQQTGDRQVFVSFNGQRFTAISDNS